MIPLRKIEKMLGNDITETITHISVKVLFFPYLKELRGRVSINQII